MKIKKIKTNKGFTLIELMVSTFIFTFIMLASMGSLLVTLDSARNSRALRFAMDNVNFAMESVTRSIRMGTHYYCASAGESIIMIGQDDNYYKDCKDGTSIAFVPQKPDINYSKIGYKIHARGDGTHSVQRCEGNKSCVDIVSPDIDIEKLNFTVTGSSPSDGRQSSVYIVMKGNVLVKGVPTSFAIQTMATQRNF